MKKGRCGIWFSCGGAGSWVQRSGWELVEGGRERKLVWRVDGWEGDTRRTGGPR